MKKALVLSCMNVIFLPLICVLSVFVFLLGSYRLSNASQDSELFLFFLDVGQGDSLILHQPGKCTALVDAGPPQSGHRITKALEELGVTGLSLVIITHPHLDHIGGLFDIPPHLIIDNFHDTGATNPSEDHFAEYIAIRDAQNYSRIKRGDQLTCGDLTFSVLYPDYLPRSSDDPNKDSMVMMISYHHFKLLHMGDLAGTGEENFLELGDDIQATILKVAHHGGPDATGSILLRRAEPKFAVISSGMPNKIGAPDKTVINRLTDSQITLLRTDQTGTIRMKIDSSDRLLTLP